MKDIETLAIECMLEMDALNIKYGDVISFEFAKMASYGDCEKVGKKFKIRLSAWLANDDIPDKIVKDTLLHELIHTVEGCFNHGHEFKHFAFLLNTKYGYTIQRIATDEEMEYYHKYNKTIYKYEVGCPVCGSTWKRQKKCSLINNPGKYRCGKCKEKLIRLV